MKAIIFDCFGVICDEIAPFVLPKYMTAEDAVRYKASVVDDADRGHITQEEMFEKLGEIAHAPAAELLGEFWKYVRVRPETVALIRDLKPHYKVGLLTNAITPFIHQILDQNGLKPLFDASVISSEEGIAKPDAEIFEMMLQRLDVPAGEAIFLDDNPVNIKGAQAVGLNTLLFTDADAARIELSQMGIIGV